MVQKVLYFRRNIFYEMKKSSDLANGTFFVCQKISKFLQMTSLYRNRINTSYNGMLLTKFDTFWATPYVCVFFSINLYCQTLKCTILPFISSWWFLKFAATHAFTLFQEFEILKKGLCSKFRQSSKWNHHHLNEAPN